MFVAAFTILGPLAALVLILLVRRFSPFLALLGTSAGLAAALYTLVAVANGAIYTAQLPGLHLLPFRLVADPQTALFSVVVAGVSLFVLVYAVGYMREEAGQVRFYAEMSLFVTAMQTLVLAGDWLLFLAGWELIGLSSYLLIGFWYERAGVKQAATQAFLVTRTADLGLYLGIFWLVNQAGTTKIEITLQVKGDPATFIGLLLLLAAMGKAAQVPFQGWLQAAMAGPTPVSALLHSATLVAAGAILLIRAFPLLPAPVLFVVGIVGGITALLTGVMAVAQTDLKKMLAASTSSQLAFMLLAIGAGSVGGAVIHLVIHAAMKSALFLGAGIFQHLYHATSFDDLAGKGRRHAWTFGGFALAGLALAGVPPLAGFWSKDAIVAATFNSSNGWLLAPFALLGTFLTGVYVARALRLLWQIPATNGDGITALPEKAKEKMIKVVGLGWMEAGLGGLAVLAAALGLAVQPIADLVGSKIPENSLSLVLSLALALAGLALGWFSRVEIFLEKLRGWAADGFRLGGGFQSLVVRPALVIARGTDRLDRLIHGGVKLVGETTLGVARMVGRQGYTRQPIHQAPPDNAGLGSSIKNAGARSSIETALGQGIKGIGRLSLALARLVRLVDEQGIGGLIAALVRGIKFSGQHVRKLQSGLVHRELLLTSAAVALLIIILLVSR